MELSKYDEALIDKLVGRNRVAFLVEKHGITLDFRQRQVRLVGSDDDFQQFVDNVRSMIDLGARDELSEATDIGNEDGSGVGHM